MSKPTDHIMNDQEKLLFTYLPTPSNLKGMVSEECFNDLVQLHLDVLWGYRDDYLKGWTKFLSDYPHVQIDKRCYDAVHEITQCQLHIQGDN